MNKEEILQSKPGRDLDSKVALEVMGYVWLKHLLQFSAELAVKWLGTPADLKESCGMYTIVSDSQFIALKERENHREAVLHFSTELEAANQVIDRMKELGYEYNLEIKREEGGDSYHVSFYKSERKSKDKLVGFTTLPEAVAKAALLATLSDQ